MKPACSLAAVALVVGVAVTLPDSQAIAADSTVTTISELHSALADCSAAPNTITLGADIADPLAALQVNCDTELALSTYDLSIRNVVLAGGVTLEVTGPTDGTGGTLEADASDYDFNAGIRTTGATLRVSGGTVVAHGGINAAAIGANLAGHGGTLHVAGGEVRAIAYPTAYGTAIGGGYISGNGGVVHVSSGSLYAEADSTYGVAIGGGGAGANGNGGSGATVSVTGGTLTAVATGTRSTAIGGGVSGLGGADRGGTGGSLTIGAAGEVVVESPRSAFGGGWSHISAANFGDFGSLHVAGILRLPSGGLYVGTDPAVAHEVTISASGAVLGQETNPASGASITGTGLIANQGTIALASPASMVSGNNRLLTFTSGVPDVRVFSPSLAEGYRLLPTAPAGTAWNTAADGSGTWFAAASPTSGTGTTALYSVSPATVDVSPNPRDLIAVSGQPFVYPVTVLGPDGVALSPQPAVGFASADCALPSDRVFLAVGECTVLATATVENVDVSATFTMTVVAGPPTALTLTASSMTVKQGGTVSFDVVGTDASGNPADTSGVVLSSSVGTDIVSGRSVTFPTASPHVITARIGSAQTSLTIEVIPTPKSALSNTGAGSTPTVLLVGSALALLLGGGALLARRRATLE